MVVLRLAVLDANGDGWMTNGITVLNGQFGLYGQCVMSRLLVMVQSTTVLLVDDVTKRITEVWTRLLLHDAVDVFLMFGRAMNDDLAKRFVMLATEYASMIVYLCRRWICNKEFHFTFSRA